MRSCWVCRRRELWSWPQITAPLAAIGLTLVHSLFWTDLRMRAPIVPAIALIAAGAALPRLIGTADPGGRGRSGQSRGLTDGRLIEREMGGEREFGPPREHQPPRHREANARGRHDSHDRRGQSVPVRRNQNGRGAEACTEKLKTIATALLNTYLKN